MARTLDHAPGTWTAFVAVALAATFSACSSGKTTSSGTVPGDNGSSDDDSGTGPASSGGSSGSQGASQASSSGGAGSGSSSGSSVAKGASSGGGTGSTTLADGGAASDAAAPMPSHGCGQGTSCTPGTDLAAPATADGFQIVLPPNSVTIQPGQEAYYCYYKTIPGNAAIQVGAFQSWMSSGSSHHFITYQGGNMPDGTLQQCAIGNGKWVYATSVAGQVIELKMPDGVGLQMSAGTQLILNMHFINPGATPVSPSLKLNVLYAQNVQYQAAAMTSFNASIYVPPATGAGPGQQTVSGTCTAPVGSKFFAITTHTHKHATAAKVNFVSGGMTQNIVDTTDWESPDVGLWYAPDFLTVGAGDSFSYSCSYTNTGTTAVTVGETAATNEMCMAIGYYFPAGTTSCN